MCPEGNSGWALQDLPAWGSHVGKVSQPPPYRGQSSSTLSFALHVCPFSDMDDYRPARRIQTLHLPRDPAAQKDTSWIESAKSPCAFLLTVPAGYYSADSQGPGLDVILIHRDLGWANAELSSFAACGVSTRQSSALTTRHGARCSCSGIIHNPALTTQNKPWPETALSPSQAVHGVNRKVIWSQRNRFI